MFIVFSECHIKEAGDCKIIQALFESKADAVAFAQAKVNRLTFHSFVFLDNDWMDLFFTNEELYIIELPIGVDCTKEFQEAYCIPRSRILIKPGPPFEIEHPLMEEFLQHWLSYKEKASSEKRICG